MTTVDAPAAEPPSADPATAERAPRRSGPVNGGPALLLMALGLVLVAQAAVDARDSAGPGPLDQALYVGGLLLVFVPAAAAAVLPRIAGSTRVLLVVSMMVLLQLGRLVVEPTRFVQPGELVSLNGLRVLQETDRLYGDNPLAPVTSAYPGLQVATDAIRDLTGLGDHLSGVVVLVAARVLLALTLLLVVAWVSRSTRVGAAAVVVYAVNPHLPVLGAAFDAQTLALPLAVLTGFLAVSRRRGSPLGLLPAGLALVAVVVTDQLTALALVVVLAVWAVLDAVLWRSRGGRGGGSAVALALLAVLGAAGLGVSLALSGTGLTRPWEADGSRLMLSGVVLEVAPAWEQAALVAALVLTLVVLTVALLRSGPPVVEEARQRRLETPDGRGTHPADGGFETVASATSPTSGGNERALAVLLRSIAVLVVVVLVGLLGPGAAALADRAASLVYLGVAFVVAGWVWSSRPSRRGRRTQPRERRARLLVVGAGAVFVGAGVLGAGALTDQLPGPFRPADGARSVDPGNTSAAEWMATRLPEGSGVYADRVGGLLAATVGGQDVVRRVDTGTDASALLLDPDAGPDDLRLARESGIRYLVADRRNADALPRQGYYVEPGEAGQDDRTVPVPLEALRKFSAVEGVDVVYDNGDVVVYDLGGLDDD